VKAASAFFVEVLMERQKQQKKNTGIYFRQPWDHAAGEDTVHQFQALGGRDPIATVTSLQSFHRAHGYGLPTTAFSPMAGQPAGRGAQSA